MVNLVALWNTLLGSLEVYMPQVDKGFFCDDLTIRYPYHPEHQRPWLLIASSLPVFMMITADVLNLLVRVGSSPLSAGRSSKSGVNSSSKVLYTTVMWIFGAICTALFTAVLKVTTGRLAPNFLAACGLQNHCEADWVLGSKVDFGILQNDFICLPPGRQREVIGSFPCIVTAMSSFNHIYVMLVVVCLTSKTVLNLHPSRSLARPLIILFCLFSPVVIGATRLVEYRAHPSDIIAGLVLGAITASVMVYSSGLDAWLTAGHSETEQKHSGSEIKSFKLCVGVCTSAIRDNIEGLIQEMQLRFGEMISKVEFIQLPYSKLEEFKLEDKVDQLKINVLILCHSIENRRLSLTNVTDALYNDFIPRAANKLGKDNFLVLGHDFTWDIENTKEQWSNHEALKLKQPTVYAHAAKVMLAGNLRTGNRIRISGDDWKAISELLHMASKIQEQSANRK